MATPITEETICMGKPHTLFDFVMDGRVLKKCKRCSTTWDVTDDIDTRAKYPAHADMVIGEACKGLVGDLIDPKTKVAHKTCMTCKKQVVKVSDGTWVSIVTH